jgi:hypothetical protein
MEEHTVTERVDYKLCLAPQSHQEPISRHRYYLLSSNARTLLVLFLVKRAGKLLTYPVAQIQIYHQLLYQTLSSPHFAGCYNCFIQTTNMKKVRPFLDDLFEIIYWHTHL